jgi:hypothetical protein
MNLCGILASNHLTYKRFGVWFFLMSSKFYPSADTYSSMLPEATAMPAFNASFQCFHKYMEIYF